MARHLGKRFCFVTKIMPTMTVRSCMLTSSFVIALVWLPLQSVTAQSFTRVTTGAIVAERASSLGVAWGDYDNDGDQDLFIGNTNVANSLFQNNGDGTFTKVTTGPIAADTGDSRGSVWVDYDNDGNLDLYVSNRGGNVPPPVTAPVQANFLYRNDGPPNYTFTKITDQPAVTEANFTWSSSWVDYDNDGDLDLHMPDNLHAADDFFFENDGSGNFTAVTPAFVELGSEPSTGVASWIDFDDDGDQDVLLAKSGRFLAGGAENNRLFRNQLSETGTLTFEEITTGGIVTHFDNDFQASWGDYDNDGDMDVLLGHAGGPRGIANLLYRNDGDAVFTRIRTGRVATDRDGTLGSGWGDYDNDGDLDLLVANGGLDKLYQNNGDGTFTSMTANSVGPIVSTSGNSWGAAWADYDNDGFLDAIIVNQGGPNYLYRNAATNDNHWISLTAVGTTSNRSGIGAKITVWATIDGQATQQVRHISGSPTGDRSQNSLRAHFGLGDAIVIDSLRIAWPSGLSETYFSVSADQFLVITEGESLSGVTNEATPTLPVRVELGERYPNPMHERSTIRYTLHEAGPVRLEVFDSLGRLVDVVVDSTQTPGTHEATFTATNMPSGLYHVRIRLGGYAQSKPLLIVK